MKGVGFLYDILLYYKNLFYVMIVSCGIAVYILYNIIISWTFCRKSPIVLLMRSNYYSTARQNKPKFGTG